MLRHIADLGGTATDDAIQAHFAGHPRHPDPEEPDRRHTHLHARGTPPHRPGQQHLLLELDDRVRVYRIDPALLKRLQWAFAVTDCRPDRLRQDPTVT
ncbi:hypothetical protein [Streptomyces sp. NPDC057403]|uniref:hypothetical protein n=1 Tax=Streptomyces sp. NPDC057403 TaxID=3346119 RepID=UPI0036A64FA1